MNNFIFENKTKVYFGKGGVKEYLGCLLDHYGDTVMLAYGGGSIKHNGIYDEVLDILNAKGKRVVEFSGIMPNPTYAKVQEGRSWHDRHGIRHRQQNEQRRRHYPRGKEDQGRSVGRPGGICLPRPYLHPVRSHEAGHFWCV